jgi:hypothetical protein
MRESNCKILTEYWNGSRARELAQRVGSSVAEGCRLETRLLAAKGRRTASELAVSS